MAKLIEIIGTVLSGEWGTDDETGDGIPVLRTTNFTNEGVVNYNNLVTRIITKKNIEEKYLRKGDIIIEKSGGSDKFPVGRVIYFDGEDNTYLFNNFTVLLRVKDQELWYPRYVFYSLFANYKRGGTRAFENKTTGLHNLKIDDYVSRYEVVEIGVTEQVLICDKLDKLYEIIKLRKQEIQLLDDLIKARFVELFGDPIRNTQNKPTTEFINVVKMQRGFDLPVQDRQQDGDIPVFGSNGALDHHNVAKVRGGGVITGRSGTIGNVYYTEGDYWPLNTSLFSVDTHGNNIVYLAY
ncbi:MAG: restriction endonuclease subunit S, partial [Lachnospiraceae bacterium]|nr:restriction endonuclease subunit S [Lachnospiraceae bacterium]